MVGETLNIGDVVTLATADPKVARLMKIEKLTDRGAPYAKTRIVMVAHGGSTAHLGACVGEIKVEDLVPVNPMLVIARISGGEMYWEAFLPSTKTETE